MGSLKVVDGQQCKANGIAAACTAIERLREMQERAHLLTVVHSACSSCLKSLWLFAMKEYHHPAVKLQENMYGVAVNLTHWRG
jgi:hypothetical protein